MPISDRILRYRRGRSRSAYARALGVSAAAVFRWEAGDYLPHVGRINDIARDANLDAVERLALLDELANETAAARLV